MVEGEDEEQRRARIATNEALYRNVSDSLDALNRALSTVVGDLSMVITCECGDLACAEMIKVPVETYEASRGDATLFLIVPGHEINDVEDTISHTESYDIVCKHKGEGERVARATDARR